MAVIENTAVIPKVSADFHLLEIETIEAVEGTKYGEPDIAETRIRMQLRVRTPGEPDESFTAWMSPKLSEKATLGAIVLATLGSAPTDSTFDTDSVDWSPVPAYDEPQRAGLAEIGPWHCGTGEAGAGRVRAPVLSGSHTPGAADNWRQWSRPRKCSP